MSRVPYGAFHMMPRKKTPILVSFTKSTKYTDVLDQYILIFPTLVHTIPCPDSKVHEANWGPSEADRTQVGPMLAPWTLLSGFWPSTHRNFQFYLRFYGILWHRRCSTRTSTFSKTALCCVNSEKHQRLSRFIWGYVVSQWAYSSLTNDHPGR